MDVMVQLISQVGFPIFTALYFMTTTTKVLNQNTQAINELKSTNLQILTRIEENKKVG